MTERETTRLKAWSTELRLVHSKLRAALDVAYDSVDDVNGSPDALTDLLVYCRGFCVALDRHHKAEDRALFPVIERAYPELRPVLRNLQTDHSMIDHLLGGLQKALDSPNPDTVRRHLDGISAVMQTHFRYEERQLLQVLDTLALDVTSTEVFGDL